MELKSPPPDKAAMDERVSSVFVKAFDGYTLDERETMIWQYINNGFGCHACTLAGVVS